MRYTVLSRLLGFFAVAALIAGASAEVRAQVVPALWEIEDTGAAYAALRTQAAVASKPVYAEGNLLDPAEFGCLIGGAMGAVALYADPTLLGLLMDGAAATGWPAAYAAGGGLIVAAVCTVAQVLGPVVVTLYERYISPSGTFNARDMRP
jgi:hypothetical protein